MGSRKVALITMHRVLNAGSVLQAYALQKAIVGLGFECDIVNYAYPDVWHVLHSEGCAAGGSGAGQGLVRRLLRGLGLFTIAKKINFHVHDLRNRRKVSESIDCLSCTKKLYHKGNIGKLPRYDIYVTGSDQVWNPRYIGRDYSFFWDFTPDDAKRVAYAASFGDRVLPEEVKPDYHRLLLRYASVSLRERSGKEIVSALTGGEAVMVLDPTFLLGRKEWERLAAEIPRPVGDYIFVYLLDYVFNPFPAIYDFISNLHRVTQKTVIVSVGNSAVPSTSWPEGVRFIDGYLSPRAFVRLMTGASMVVSNSFHGIAFAANFHKKFIAVLNPLKTNDDRVKEFLQTIGMSSFGEPIGAGLSEDLIRRALQNERDWRMLENNRSLSRVFLEGALCR